MYITMRDEMHNITGKKQPDKKSISLKEDKLMSDDDIIKKIQENRTFAKKANKSFNDNNKWIKTEYSHPGVYVIKIFIHLNLPG